MPNPNLEPYKGDSINLSDIAEGGGFNKVGEYVVRLLRLDPTTTAKGEPMLVVYFEVLEGQDEGEEIRYNFWLGARKDKVTGKVWAGGISEFKHACAAIGQPLAEKMDFKMDANVAGRLFANLFIHKRIRLKVLPDQERKDADGNLIAGRWENGRWIGPTRPRILGLATGPTTTPVNMQNGGQGAPPEPVQNPLKGIV